MSDRSKSDAFPGSILLIISYIISTFDMIDRMKCSGSNKSDMCLYIYTMQSFDVMLCASNAKGFDAVLCAQLYNYRQVSSLEYSGSRFSSSAYAKYPFPTVIVTQ